MNDKTNEKTRKKGRPAREPRLGIDIGGVVLGPTAPDGHRDTRFLHDSDEGALRTPAIPGALETIARLVERYEGRVWLVSKCGERIEKRSRAWLRHNDVFARTGLAPDHLRFCRRRPDKRIHARQLRLTAFLDDRVDVLEHLRGDVEELFLFGHQRSPADDGWYEHLVDWDAVAGRLLALEQAA